MLLPTSHPAAGFEAKDLLEAFEVFRFHCVESQSHGNSHEDALAPGYFLLDSVEEYIAVVADHHAEPWHRLAHFVEFVQHVADGLRAVPVAWLASVGQTYSGDTVNRERTDLVVFNVIQEESQQLVVFIKRRSLAGVSQSVLVAESVSQHVSLQALEEKHLASAEHASPTCITCIG